MNREEHLQEVVDAILSLSTNNSDEYEDLAYRLAKKHPLHQQNFMRLCVAFIIETAGYDAVQGAQNFDAVKFAEKVVQTIDAEDMRIRF